MSCARSRTAASCSPTARATPSPGKRRRSPSTPRPGKRACWTRSATRPRPGPSGFPRMQTRCWHYWRRAPAPGGGPASSASPAAPMPLRRPADVSARGFGWWTMPSPPVARSGIRQPPLGRSISRARARCASAIACSPPTPSDKRSSCANGLATRRARPTTRHNLAQLGVAPRRLRRTAGPSRRVPGGRGSRAWSRCSQPASSSRRSSPAGDRTRVRLPPIPPSLPTAATAPAAPRGRQTTRAPQIRTPDRVGARPAPVAVSRRRPARRASRPRRYHSARSRSGRPATPRSSTPRTPRPTAPPSAESRSAAPTPAISPSPGTSAGIARCRPMPSAPWP